MTGGTGQQENRLDRIEAALEALVRSQAHLLQAQTVIEQEHKDLLRSQILMQDELRQFASKSEKRFERIETGLAEAADKLNALIDWMDRHTREHDQGKG